MQLYVIAIALPVLILGCANPQLLLHNPGTLVLKKGDQTVELREGAELALWWSVDGGSESTRSMVDGESRLAKVQIVEANEAYVRLKSVSWNKRGDFPAAYIAAKDLQLTLQSGAYKKPLVGVPIGQVEEIVLYGRAAKSRRAPGFWKTGKWMVAGAAGGSMLILYFFEDALPEMKDSEVLTLAVAGGAIGAVSYPVHKYLMAGYEQTTRVYPVGGRGYRIEIKR